MTQLFALLNSGGSVVAEESSHAPYYIGGLALLILLALLAGLLAFGKGREHS